MSHPYVNTNHCPACMAAYQKEYKANYRGLNHERKRTRTERAVGNIAYEFTPEQLLACAVLCENLLVATGRGTNIYEGNSYRSGNREQRAREQRSSALEWVTSDDMDYIFSFRSICEHLGFKAERIREALRRGEVMLMVNFLARKTGSYRGAYKTGRYRRGRAKQEVA